MMAAQRYAPMTRAAYHVEAVRGFHSPGTSSAGGLLVRRRGHSPGVMRVRSKGRELPDRALVLREAVDPGENLLVPPLRILRLEHPVVLLGEVEEAAGDAAPLQRGEGRHALRVDDAVVLAAVD